MTKKHYSMDWSRFQPDRSRFLNRIHLAPFYGVGISDAADYWHAWDGIIHPVGNSVETAITKCITIAASYPKESNGFIMTPFELDEIGKCILNFDHFIGII